MRDPYIRQKFTRKRSAAAAACPMICSRLIQSRGVLSHQIEFTMKAEGAKVMSDPKTRQLAVKGRVIPEYTGVTTPTINISWQYTELDLHLKARISINNSIVNVTCEMNKLDNQDHLNKALIEFDRLAGILVNAQSFGTGLGLELRFDTFSIDGGPDRPHWVADVKLAALATMTRTKEDQLYIFELAHNNLTFSMVLRHLNEALLAPRRVVVRTTQAIDGLRSLLVPPGGKDKDGWREMQNNLNLSENYLKTITEASKGLRHGNYTELPGANRTDIAYRAWEVMNRFISYKKGGSVPLSKELYPVL
jgi:hypothetical protein